MFQNLSIKHLVLRNVQPPHPAIQTIQSLPRLPGHSANALQTKAETQGLFGTTDLAHAAILKTAAWILGLTSMIHLEWFDPETGWNPLTRMPTRRIKNPGIIAKGEEKGSVKCGAWSKKCQVWSVKCKV